jgi:hypothetical protein
LFDEQFESIEEGVNESIDGRTAGLLGDVGPDLLEVLLGKSGEPIEHLGFLGASRTITRLDPLGELSTRRPVVRLSLATRQLKTGLPVIAVRVEFAITT